MQPPVTVVNLPDLKSGVLLLDREDVDAATLGQRLNHLVSVPSGAVLHLVLVGGGPADRPLLEEADRNARNPNRLGVWHLDDGGQLAHVVGRKLSLLPEAAKRLPTAPPLAPGAIAAAAERARLAQDEAMAFATRLQAPAPAGHLDPVRRQHRSCSCWRVCGAGPRASLEAEVLMGANTGRWSWRRRDLAAAVPRFPSRQRRAPGREPDRPVQLWAASWNALLGWRRFLVLYAASALAGGLASAFIGGPRLSVGASGAIWGLLGGGLRPGTPGSAAAARPDVPAAAPPAGADGASSTSASRSCRASISSPTSAAA